MRTMCVSIMFAIAAWTVQANAAWLQKKTNTNEGGQAATTRQPRARRWCIRKA